MNPDREMQMEAMDEAQDEILRLTEALAVEKGAHVETAKALVACRNSLSECAHAWSDYLRNKDNIGWAIEELVRDAEAALSHTAGDDYVSKASVRPIVEALKEFMFCPTCEGRGKWQPECQACLSGEPMYCTCVTVDEETCPQCNGAGNLSADVKHGATALEQAKLLGLV